MNILVISQYYFPEQFRITDVCEELARRGNNVTVLTGLPNYPEGEIFPGYENYDPNPKMYNSVEVIRCKNRPRHKGILNLVLNYLSFCIKSSIIVRKLSDSFDFLFVYGISPITMAIPAIRYKKLHNIPIYYYCMDLWPEAIRELSENKVLKKSNPLHVVAKIISSYVYKHVDLIGVKCAEFISYLRDYMKVPPEKIVVLEEHAESVYLEIPEKLVNDNCFNFVFMGNIGHAQHCEVIIYATEKIITDKEFKVHFVGDGSDLDHLNELVYSKSLDDKILFHGKYPLSEMRQFYEMADCCLLTLSSKTESGLTPPGKLFGYMAAGKPIVAAINGAASRIIDEAKCGLCVNDGDVNGFAYIMEKAMDMDINEMGKNGRRYFLQNYTIDKFVDNLLIQVKRMIKNR